MKDKILLSSRPPSGWLWKRIQESLLEPIEGRRYEVPKWSLDGIANWEDISNDLEKVNIIEDSKNVR
jgi:hypothetical protein